MLLLDHPNLLDIQIPTEIPKYSGSSRWLISPNHTSPQEVEVMSLGPTEWMARHSQ